MRLILLLLLYSLYLSLPVSFSRAEEPSSENSSTNSIADIEPELQKIIDKDNQAQAEVDKWIRDQMTLNKDSEIQMDDPTLPLRVRDHFSEIKQLYEDYLSTHPDSMQGRLAYASFLSDIGNENDATVQWNKLIEKHPQNPVLWNNLGNSFAQRSAPEKAFSYYEEAIRLAPKEPLYVKNLAAVVYLFRREAMDYYLLNELQAIQLAQTLYEKAALMDPDDFVLATHGWKKVSSSRLFDTLSFFANKGLRVLATNIQKDGMLSSPDFELYSIVKQKFPNIILQASGGIASYDDIQKLEYIGLDEAIVGKALYENKINLEKVLHHD